MEFDDSTMSSLNAAAASQDYASISPSAYALDSQANYGRPRPQRFIDVLISSPLTPPAGHYELQALNVLDTAAFREVIARFPPGPIAILNEGLLVYLNNAEKEILCQNIRECLLARGGCWITADIYLQRPADAPPIAQSESYRQWEEQHQIEEKKFKNFADAATFFRRMGFTVDKEARPNYDRLTSLARLREAAGPAAIEQLRQPGRTRLHTTWRLTA